MKKTELKKTVLSPTFTDFLESLSIVSSKNDEKPILEIPAKKCRESNGFEYTEPSVKIFSKSEGGHTISGFRNKLQAILFENDHVCSNEVIDAILAITVASKTSGVDRFEFLDECIKCIELTDVSHFLILPVLSNGCELKFSGYSLGSLEDNILKSRCIRTGSDYYDRYGKMLKGKFALRSPEFKCRVVNFSKIGINSRLSQSQQWNILVLNYFELISKVHLEDMWANLENTQIFNSPFETHIIDPVNLRNNAFKLSETISIYLFDNLGYVVPESKGIILNQIDSKDDAAIRYFEHKKQYQIDKITDSEIGRALNDCARFCDESGRFLKLGRENEASLYAVICLEYLFSESKEIATDISRRCAVLTYLRMGGEYKKCFNELKQLYSARSKFVHEGVKVTRGQATRLFDYARETLRALLVLHTNEMNRQTGFREKWIKNLDFIAAGFDAGNNFENNLLAEAGIFWP